MVVLMQLWIGSELYTEPQRIYLYTKASGCHFQLTEWGWVVLGSTCYFYSIHAWPSLLVSQWQQFIILSYVCTFWFGHLKSR